MFTFSMRWGFKRVMSEAVERRLVQDRNMNDLVAVMENLTFKQREVLLHVSEGRSTKEIAGILGVSDSAVNQRIEVVRARAGGVGRSELGRAYRTYLRSRDASLPNTSIAASTSSECCESLICEKRNVCPDFVRALLPAARVVEHYGAKVRFLPNLMRPTSLFMRTLSMVVIAVGLFTVKLVGFCAMNAFAELV